MRTYVLFGLILLNTSLSLASPLRGFYTVENKDIIAVLENDEKVIVYQKNTEDKKYARAHYFHPLYSMYGQELTENYPEDHLHHHGVWWGWHQVIKDGKLIGNSWKMDNIQWNFKDYKCSFLDSGQLALSIDVDWLDGDDKLLIKEKCDVTFYPAEKDYRVIGFDITLTGDGSVKLGGADNVKEYGGFSTRFINSKSLKFNGNNGLVEPTNTPVNAGPWMNFTWEEGKVDAGVVIMCGKENDSRKQPWILRKSNSMQNPVFPGREPITVDKEGITLSYGLIIHTGNLKNNEIEQIYSNYKQKLGKN